MNMQKINYNKILFNMDRYFGDKQPVTAEFMLTNYCNNKCGYCRYNHEAGQYMNFETFKKAIDKLVKMGVEAVVITGGGEPTVSPDFDKITQYLEAENIPYGINTNLNLYKEIKPTYLKVSLDATNHDEYKSIRGVDAYERVIKNINRYAEFKAMKSPKTTLGIQIVCADPRQGIGFYEAYKHLPVDYIQVRPIESVGGNFYDLEAVRPALAEYEEIAKHDSKLLISPKWYDLNTRFKKCHAGWSVITVKWDGNVSYCCHKPDEIVGSIFDEDIQQKKINFKSDMCKCDIPCRLTGANKFLEMIENGSEHQNFI